MNDPLMEYANALERGDFAEIAKIMKEHPEMDYAVSMLHSRYDGERPMPELLIMIRETH